MPLAVALYAYQKAWITDEARFKLAVKSRQIGWTFGTTLRHVRKRLAQGGTTIWVSASERQSREAIEYVKQHLTAIEEAFEYSEIEFPGIEAKAEQITLRHNGARIIAMPANPDTMRGFAGDVVLDEFAFHKDAVKIWRAALAIASRGYQVEVISTPNGQSGKYFDLCKEAGVPLIGEGTRRRWVAGQWSVHYLTLEMAAAEDCPIDPKVMREVAGDEDTFLQEYCCVFLADAENFIPMETVIACESENATLELPVNFRAQGPLYLGGDIGRKKDRSVFPVGEKLGDVLVTRAVVTLDRTPFEAQWQVMDSLLSLPGMMRACLDATGIGAQLAERAVSKYGAGRVEAVVFNLENKERMAVLTKTHFENRTVRIPASPRLRSAINAVKRFSSPTGHFRFDADRTELGHADEFWGIALMLSAAAGPALSVDCSVAQRSVTSEVFGTAHGESVSSMAAGY